MIEEHERHWSDDDPTHTIPVTPRSVALAVIWTGACIALGAILVVLAR